MPTESLLPAGRLSPSAGTCRGARDPGAPLPSPGHAAEDLMGGVPLRLRRNRFGPRWMFVGPYAVPAPPYLFVRTIQRAVEARYGLEAGALCSARRERAVARPRQIAMYLCRHLTGRSLPDIGRRFGDRHHTTVLHALRTIEALRSADLTVERELRFLARALTCPEPLA